MPDGHVRGGDQDPWELARFLDLVEQRNVRRYLEIGARNGDSFDAVMRRIGPGAFGLAIDIPENGGARRNLSETADQLNAEGMRAKVIFGNSQDRAVIEAAWKAGPFDLVLIDGDHRHSGVTRDYENYRGLAPVVAFHDIAAPDGHNSDGYPNDVGRFWHKIADDTAETIIAPGSLRGFGILTGKPASPTAFISRKCPPLYIEIPAWGSYYVDLACRFTVPAVLASLDAAGLRANFLVHTDDERSFRQAIGDYPIRFLPLQPMPPPPAGGKMPRLPDGYWAAFKRAHKDGLNATPAGAVAVLLNSDIVVSRECFAVVAEKFAAGADVVVSVGIRTQIENNPGPPIGASADDLFRWIWSHRHHITEECIWGRGRSHHPTILFFEDGDGVAMHGFHLTPMFVRKHQAPVRFSGTIDDDLLSKYRDEQIAYLTDGEVAFAELSPNWKTHPYGSPLSVPGVLGFWNRKRSASAAHLRNFRQRMRVLGNPTRNHPAVDQIIAGLSG